MAVAPYTVDDLHRMVRAGTLAEDARVELLDGQIVEMTPIGMSHAACVDRLNHVIGRLATDRQVILRVQNPVELAPHHLLQPDIALLRRRADWYRTQYPGPSDTLLVIEVADSTLVHDRDRKVPLYAGAGIREVWLVNLPGDCLTIHRRPLDGTYQDVRTVRRGDTVAPLAMPHLALAVSDILG